MKFTKKLLSSFLAFALVLGLLFIPTEKAQAATDTIPKKLHITTGSSYSTDIPYSAYGDYIKNLKSSNKNLKVKQTYQYAYQDAENAEDNAFYGSLTLYASKQGTYKVTFDIYSSAGTKKSSHTITVYVDNNAAISSIKVGNNTVKSTDVVTYSTLYLLNGTSGKVKVNMTKGYKLKKIEVSVYDKTKNTYVDTTIKNNSKIKFGSQVYSYNFTSSYGDYSYWRNPALAYTYIYVTYVDKYSKTELTKSYIFYKWVK